MDLESIQRRFEENHIRRVKLGAFDTDGTLRGKYISLDKFGRRPIPAWASAM